MLKGNSRSSLRHEWLVATWNYTCFCYEGHNKTIIWLEFGQHLICRTYIQRIMTSIRFVKATFYIFQISYTHDSDRFCVFLNETNLNNGLIISQGILDVFSRSKNHRGKRDLWKQKLKEPCHHPMYWFLIDYESNIIMYIFHKLTLIFWQSFM